MARTRGVPKEILSILQEKLSEEEIRKMVAETIREENPYSTPPMQKELALEFIRQPQAYTPKKCRQCGEMFGSSYSAVSYCSDTCRGKAFRDQTGIDWNFTGKTQVELWGGEPPRIINPTLWRNLRELLEILSKEEPEFVGSAEHQQPETPNQNTQTQSSSVQFLPPTPPDASGNTSELEHHLPPVYDAPPEAQERPAQTNPRSQPVELGTLEFDLGISSFDL